MQPLNLVPADCLENAVRRRRLSLWMSASAIAVVVIAVAGIQRWTASRAITQLQARLATARAREVDLDRALVLANKTHGVLLKHAAAVAALPQNHGLAAQLAELSRNAPPGVVFTRITFQRPPEGQTPPRTRPAARHTRKPPKAVHTSPGPVISMAGYAADRQELETLLQVIGAVPRWRQVRLLRAAQEPYLSTQAIAFELTCSTPEDRP